MKVAGLDAQSPEEGQEGKMKVLAVDTATHRCSVAVAVQERLAVELSVESTKTHSTRLMGMIRESLRLAELDLSELDGFAVSLGPGSFTGLRIGVSMIKGLAFATGKPCVGVSSLKALAYGCLPWPHRICALIDARKQEVYAAFYRTDGQRLEPNGDECVMAVDEAVRGVDALHLFVGSGAQLYRNQILFRLGELACFVTGDRNLPMASTVARMAQQMLPTHAEDDITRLAPRYVRPSDAELNIQPRSSL
jgi:tRNA threonylcarbamoyladenosine biosynthesis protein TsaB